MARGLVSSGLLPTLGIHHRNKYNAYCLADDIMEPYRPYVDQIVLKIIDNGENFLELSSSIKSQLLGIATVDVRFEKGKSPLMVGLQSTTASLARCYEGTLRKITYPVMRNFNSRSPANYKTAVEDPESKAAEDIFPYDHIITDDDRLPF